MAAIKNAFGRVRARTVTVVEAPLNGAAQIGGRARRWTAEVARGIRGGFGRAGGAFATASGRVRGQVGKALEAPRASISSTVDSARARPRFAIAVATAALVGVAWIAWAVYVTASNGAAAGLGVLLTWPVLIGALALVASPFVLTGVLVRRHWPKGAPPISGGANGEEPSERPEAFTGGTYPD